MMKLAALWQRIPKACCSVQPSCFNVRYWF